MGIKLVIADKEDAYIDGILEYLEIKGEKRYEQVIYDDKEKLAQYLQDNTCDILLIGESMYDSSFNYKNVNTPIYLYENYEPDALQGIDNKIYKYQRISKLLSYMLEKLAQTKPESYSVTNANRPTSIYTIYSPVGGSGKTTAAVAMAIQLAKLQKRVMYLNLERFSTTELYFPFEFKSNLSQVFGKLDMEGNKAFKVEALKSTDGPTGVNYFSRFNNLVDYEEVTAEEVEELVSIITSSGICDVIIIDTDSELDSIQRTLFDQSEKIVVVESQGKAAACKKELFYGLPQVQDQWNDKILVIQNKAQHLDNTSTYPVIGVIPEVAIEEPRRLSEYIANEGFIKI